MVRSIAISIGGGGANRSKDFIGGGQNELFERRTDRHVRSESRAPANRTVKIFERMLADNRSDFAADSAGQPILMDHENFASLARGGKYRFTIERQQRAQIKHLDAEPVFFFDDSGCVERLAERAAIRDQRKVRAFLANLRDSNRHRKVARKARTFR